MAIAMQQRMRDLQVEWRERGQEHVFQLRIGINTGFCTVGKFGSDVRIDYTVIGNENPRVQATSLIAREFPAERIWRQLRIS